MRPFVRDVTENMGKVSPSDAGLLFQYMCQIANLPESTAVTLYEDFLQNGVISTGPVRILGRHYIKGITPMFRKIYRDERPEFKMFILMIELVRGFTYSQFLMIIRHLKSKVGIRDMSYDELFRLAHSARLY